MVAKKKSIDRFAGRWNIFRWAVLCCFLWGCAAPMIKIGYEVMRLSSEDSSSILLFAGLRFFLAGILVIGSQSIVGKKILLPRQQDVIPITALALAQTIVQYFCFYLGLANTYSTNAVIITGSSGLFAILIAGILLRTERLDRIKICGCVLGMVGVTLVSISQENSGIHFSMMGEGILILAQISSGISGVLIKLFSPNHDVVLLSGWQFAIGGMVLSVIGILGGGEIEFNFLGGAVLIYLAFVSAVAYSLWSILMKYNPIGQVAIYYFAIPLFGVLLSGILIGEWEQVLKPTSLAALGFVCGGIYMINRYPVSNQVTKGK